MVALVLVALFLIWRIDNARVEQLRVSLVDRFVPSFSWTLKPVAETARMLADLRAYSRVYEQNAELRRELQRMQSWREAALQLEQKNARLLALNKVRLNPRLTFVTGEVMADSGSPFRRSATVNVGRIDGVTDGSAALDGLGPRRAHRRRRRAVVADHPPDRRLEPGAGGDPALRRSAPSSPATTATAPALEFVDQADELSPGDRVVSSGDGGLYPPDILIGRVAIGAGRAAAGAAGGRLPAARLRAGGARRRSLAPIDGPVELIGPTLPADAPPTRRRARAEAANEPAARPAALRREGDLRRPRRRRRARRR